MLNQTVRGQPDSNKLTVDVSILQLALADAYFLKDLVIDDPKGRKLLTVGELKELLSRSIPLSIMAPSGSNASAGAATTR